MGSTKLFNTPFATLGWKFPVPLVDKQDQILLVFATHFYNIISFSSKIIKIEFPDSKLNLLHVHVTIIFQTSH